MSLITFSGYPCSGKSRRAEQLKTYLEAQCSSPGSQSQQPMEVILISDNTLSIKRTVYSDGRQEKPARASLMSAIQRAIGKNKIVIVDSMNYIKGFRYQLYCAAREHKIRVCTVYVVATADLCREWNVARPAEDAYESETLENLIKRYEEPSSMVRWDSPLFTVTWTDEEPPVSQIWQAVTEGNVKPPNAGTTTVALAPTDALHNLEHTSASMVSLIFSTQELLQGSGGSITLSISDSIKPKLNLPPRSLTLSELQRLKRQFVTIHRKAITLGSTEKGTVDWTVASVANKFVTYLEENLKP